MMTASERKVRETESWVESAEIGRSPPFFMGIPGWLLHVIAQHATIYIEVIQVELPVP